MINLKYKKFVLLLIFAFSALVLSLSAGDILPATSDGVAYSEPENGDYDEFAQQQHVDAADSKSTDPNADDEDMKRALSKNNTKKRFGLGKTLLTVGAISGVILAIKAHLQSGYTPPISGYTPPIQPIRELDFFGNPFEIEWEPVPDPVSTPLGNDPIAYNVCSVCKEIKKLSEIPTEHKNRLSNKGKKIFDNKIKCELCYNSFKDILECNQKIYSLPCCSYTACETCLKRYLKLKLTEYDYNCALAKCPNCAVPVGIETIKLIVDRNIAKSCHTNLMPIEHDRERIEFIKEYPGRCARFCPKCGLDIVRTTACSHIRGCYRCGESFCIHCGSRMNSNGSHFNDKRCPLSNVYTVNTPNPLSDAIDFYVATQAKTSREDEDRICFSFDFNKYARVLGFQSYIEFAKNLEKFLNKYAKSGMLSQIQIVRGLLIVDFLLYKSQKRSFKDFESLLSGTDSRYIDATFMRYAREREDFFKQ